jgi:hypothetical protein
VGSNDHLNCYCYENPGRIRSVVAHVAYTQKQRPIADPEDEKPTRSMPTIRSLRPNVTKDEAIRQFSPPGATALLRTVMFGRLRSVAELYVPFRLFRVQITNNGVPEEKLVALDAATGTLDLYQFDHVPTEAETVSVETRNCPPAVVHGPAAAELVIAKLRRVLYSRGFFKMRGLQLAAVPLEEKLHIPYWIGFRGSDQRARVAVIDAVRRRPEGAKLRRLVEAWLTETPCETPALGRTP